MENRRPRSLAFLAQKACIKYLKRINDIGECPYDLIRPVLLKLENPDQLHQIEINSPQIIGHDGEIWLQFIKRDIPDWESKPHQPKDPKNWWKVYRKLKEQTQKDREQGAEKLKAALDSINDEREQNLAKVLSRRELPREPINHRSRTSYNYNSGKTGSKSGHKLSLLEKIRKEARDARNARIHQPTSVLVKQHAEVKKAPQGLVDDYKRSAQQKASTPTITRSPAAPRISKPPLAISRQDKSTTGMSFQEREERLRALTAGKSMPDPKSASTNNELKTSGTSQLSSRLRKPMPQNDGVVDDEDDEEPQPHATIRASSPPERRMGTPPIPRLGSPVPSLKRKAEPSIFMSAKKPKPPR